VTMEDRGMPSSVDVERAILGAVLLDNSCFWQTERLSASDFSVERHRIIYGSICSLWGDGKPIDFVTITEVLTQDDKLEKAGGVIYVTSLTDGLPRVKNIEQYVKIVMEKSRRRQFITLTAAALEEAYGNSGPIEELITRTERNLLDVETNKNSEPKHISDIIPEADAQIKADEKQLARRNMEIPQE